MVLIKKKIVGKRCDVVLIPKRPLFDMLSRHVEREYLAERKNTCIVNSKNNWTGKPRNKEVVRLLMESLDREILKEGERPYAIPHHLFRHLKCRDFDKEGNIVSEPFEGDFRIRLIKIHGRSNVAIRELRNYEPIGPFETIKIRNTLKKIEKKCEKESIWLVHHVHPAVR